MRLRESLSSQTDEFARLDAAVTAMPVVDVQTVEPPARSADPIRQQRRLSPQEVAQLVSDYRAGATTHDLAAKYNIHRMTVTHDLQRSDQPTRSNRAFEGARLERLIAEYQSGRSTEALGRQYGVAGSTVARTLRRNGITLR